jgi:hypothetical protein
MSQVSIKEEASFDKELSRQSVNFLPRLVLKRASHEISVGVPAMITPLHLPIHHLAAFTVPQLLVQSVCIDAEAIGSSCYQGTT